MALALPANIICNIDDRKVGLIDDTDAGYTNDDNGDISVVLI